MTGRGSTLCRSLHPHVRFSRSRELLRIGRKAGPGIGVRLIDNHIASVGIFIKAKLERAHGECLGASRRGRTWLAAISLGELPSKL